MIKTEITGHLPHFNTDFTSAMQRIVERMYSDNLHGFDSSGYGTWENTRDGHASDLGGREGKIASSMKKEFNKDSATLSAMYTIHQRGGLMKVTDKMRGYFWARYYETHEDKWKWMALNRSGIMSFPVRTYLTVRAGLMQYAKEQLRGAAITVEEIVIKN